MTRCSPTRAARVRNRIVHLTDEERALAAGPAGDAAAMAMRIVVRMGEVLGAERLVPIASAHIDGCLYHGDGGVEFAERLVAGAGRVRVPTTLNVGALDLLHPTRVRGDSHHRAMAERQMRAYLTMGCRPTWTCAPYQAGHRPALGTHVAWGESNAVAFANSVLGARTNRYGDFLDVCCAITGRAPLSGLHLDEARRASVVVDVSALPDGLTRLDAFYPVLGTWLGSEVGEVVAAIDGLPAADVTEDRLKALGAAAASSGAVGLFHVTGVTPEAPDLSAALAGRVADRTIRVTPAMIRAARDRLSTGSGDRLDAVALGSPHFSLDEFAAFDRLWDGTRFAVPVYLCTGRGVLARLDPERVSAFREAGAEIVVDTCVVVTPILPEGGGVLMTNSGKFAHYTPSMTGYDVIYASLSDCIASATTGRVVRDESPWG